MLEVLKNDADGKYNEVNELVMFNFYKQSCLCAFLSFSLWRQIVHLFCIYFLFNTSDSMRYYYHSMLLPFSFFFLQLLTLSPFIFFCPFLQLLALILFFFLHFSPNSSHVSEQGFTQ